ncbi:MAG: cytochrome c [Chrysiogenetes bacterium]|nr:cytochrome c [Chrysiogenetes bacterium]
MAAAVLALGGACQGEADQQPAGKRVREGEGAGRVAVVTPRHELQEINPRLLYRLHCASCHGTLGGGDGPATQVLPTQPGDWTQRGFLARFSDEQIRDKILRGTDTPPGRPQPMRGFDGKFRPEELDALVQYIREFGTRPGTLPH